ncbi:MAG: thermonuclease family protein [Pseudomonadota bacterium]
MISSLVFATLIYWSDADSGRLEDGTPFRLHGVDAPETYKPKCEAERIAGFDAKAAVIELTQSAKTIETKHHYVDDYGRAVIDLEIDGVDLADMLVEQGLVQVWDYDGGQVKPNWCS